MRLIGLLLVIFGITDFAMSWMGTDVWADWLGIQLPEWLYYFTAIIEITIGSAMMRMGGNNANGATDSE